MKIYQPFIKKALIQAAALSCIALAFAFVSNYFRPDSIPVLSWNLSEARVILDSGQDAAISFSQARDAYDSGNALFIDARAPVFFKNGHIKGAINMSWKDFDETGDGMLADVSKNACLILYCDGVNCPLSKYLANALIQRGYRDVHVLVDGWGGWRKYGMPVESGK